MAAACAWVSTVPLQSNLLLRLRSKSLVINNVKNTAFPILRADTMNRKQRLMAMCMSYKSYDQSFPAGGGKDDELGPILDFEEVMKEIQARAVNLPWDMIDSAKSIGIPKLCLDRYLSMQGFDWGLGFAMRSCSMLRDQMMIDPWYPINIGIKFGSDVFLDVIAVSFMKMRGAKADAIYLFWFCSMMVRGFACFIACRKYGDGIINQKNRSSTFAAERSWSVINAACCWSYLHWCAVIIVSNLMVWWRQV